jgi:hypothetical protein
MITLPRTPPSQSHKAGVQVCGHVIKEEWVDRGLCLTTYTWLCGVNSCGSEPQGYQVDGSEWKRSVSKHRPSTSLHNWPLTVILLHFHKNQTLVCNTVRVFSAIFDFQEVLIRFFSVKIDVRSTGFQRHFLVDIQCRGGGAAMRGWGCQHAER